MNNQYVKHIKGTNGDLAFDSLEGDNIPFGPSLEWFDPSAAELSSVTSLPLSAG